MQLTPRNKIISGLKDLQQSRTSRFVPPNKKEERAEIGKAIKDRAYYQLMVERLAKFHMDSQLEERTSGPE